MPRKRRFMHEEGFGGEMRLRESGKCRATVSRSEKRECGDSVGALKTSEARNTGILACGQERNTRIFACAWKNASEQRTRPQAGMPVLRLIGLRAANTLKMRQPQRTLALI